VFKLDSNFLEKKKENTSSRFREKIPAFVPLAGRLF
jgi:hypothetical protein